MVAGICPGSMVQKVCKPNSEAWFNLLFYKHYFWWLVRRSSSLWSHKLWSKTKLPQKIWKRSMLSTMTSSGIFWGKNIYCKPLFLPYIFWELTCFLKTQWLKQMTFPERTFFFFRVDFPSFTAPSYAIPSAVVWPSAVFLAHGTYRVADSGNIHDDLGPAYVNSASQWI